MLTTSDYSGLFDSSSLNPGHEKELVAATGIILFSSPRYQEIQARSKIPWLCIAAIHFRESGLRFDRHLHNGDPLCDRTTHIPADRPLVGDPPFKWTDSAADALSQVWRPKEWNLGTALEFLERYNGLGYQLKHGIHSPYVWSYLSAYKSGLYVSDGSFDPTAVSRQAGCAAIFKWLKQIGHPLDFTV